MPLSNTQTDILRCLAAHRSPESYVAVATAIHQNGPRFSADIDIFHDLETGVEQASAADTELLAINGFTHQWIRRVPGIHAAIIRRNEEATRLEWVRDADYRFFPTLPDTLFGYRLHIADLATNEARAAAGRREPRDVLDLLFIDRNHLPLGAVLWAAVAKDPGFSPESLVTEIRRNARYLADDYADLRLLEPVDAGEVARDLRAALADAELFFQSMPPGNEACLFLQNGIPVQPDPANLASYTAHPGCRRGHWPSSPEIASAMLHTSAAQSQNP